MYNSRKRLEDIPQELTAIWTCTREGCISWIRDNFAFAETPTCHQCHSQMKRSMVELPVIVNTREDQKFLEEGIKIQKESQ